MFSGERKIVYAIVDPSMTDDLVGRTAAVIDGGAAVVQLRDKDSDLGRVYERALSLREQCHERGALFIVNDRLDIGLACGADGVHLGPQDVPVRAARKVVPDNFIVGASAGTVARARQLQREGADYLGVGAIYEARKSKPDASAPRGPAIIDEICQAVNIPLVGIGGITVDNARAVVDAGAQGVAVIRALMAADRPEAAAAALVQAING